MGPTFFAKTLPIKKLIQLLKEKFIISNVSNAEYKVAIGKNYFTLVKQGNTNQHSYLFTSLINTCRRNR